MTGTDGRIVTAAGIAIIAFERRLAHPIHDVWAALTEPGQFADWLGAGTLEPRANGGLRSAWGPRTGLSSSE
jgi:uncharacterized protein YndB with AHSA1/START domain